MRRIERLINLIAALLDRDRPMTAAEIRAQIAGYDRGNFESFRRTFERDKQALRAMGIPLDVVKTDPWAEHADGYIIPKDRYYLPELDLDDDELAALRIAAEVLLGGRSDATSGLLKLSVGSPSVPHGGPRLIWGADLAAEHPGVGALYTALGDRHAVRFSYLSAQGVMTTRIFETYGLVHHGGGWYAVGRDVEKDEIRTFKAGRIASDVEVLDALYEIPEGFDAPGYVRAAWEIGSEAPDKCVVRFDPSMRWWAEQNMRGFPSTEGPHGELDVELAVANVDALISWALQFGDAVEIVSPQAARDRMVDRLRPFLEVAT